MFGLLEFELDILFLAGHSFCRRVKMLMGVTSGSLIEDSLIQGWDPRWEGSFPLGGG